MKKLIRTILIGFVLALMALIATTAAADAKETSHDEAPSEAEGCSRSQLGGGYEENPDGSCGLTGKGWNFGDSCPASNDASNGDWGSVNCNAGPGCIGGQCGCTGPCSGGGGDPDPRCTSARQCWGDSGRFDPGTAGEFIDECLRIGGGISEVHFDDGDHGVTCFFDGSDTHYSCLFFPTHKDCYIAIGSNPLPTAEPGHSEYLDEDSGYYWILAPTGRPDLAPIVSTVSDRVRM